MFTPYNPNPRGINTGDCVIRAIPQDIANNSAQSAYLLSQLGKFVINAPATAAAG